MICYGKFVYLGRCEKTGANLYLVGTSSKYIVRVFGRLTKD